MPIKISVSGSIERHMEEVVKDFKAALPQLKNERDQLLTKLKALNAKIQAAEMLINAFDDSPPDESQKVAASTPSGRAPRRLVYDHVGKVLASGQQYSVSNLRREIDQRFRIRYGIASLYRALKAGLKDGKYVNQDGSWRAKQGGHQ